MDEAVTRLFRRASVGPRRAVRRYFGYRIVTAWQLPAIMRKHIYTGAMGNIYAHLLSGVFFVYFGNRVGLTPFDWGLMGGLTSFLILAQVFSALLTEVSGRRKLVWFVTAFTERALRLAGILAAFVLWSNGKPGVAFALIASVCASNLLGAMASPPWLSWLADIIPAKSHGQFWGRRAAWVSLSVIVVMAPIGFLMDRVGDEGKMVIAMWTFAIGGVIGLVDIIIHGTIPEPRIATIGGADALRRLFTPLRDRGYRPWLVFNFCWTASMSLGGSLATVYIVEDLKIKQNMLAGALCVTGCSLLGGMLTSRWSGRLVDRLGIRRVLQWSHMGWALLPGLWIVATPETAVAWLTVTSLWGGAFSAAGVNAATKLITRWPPPPERPMYAAMSSCLGNLAGGAGALAAGFAIRAMEGCDWHMAGRVFGGFHVIFVVSLVLRMASAIWLLPRIRENPGEIREHLPGDAPD